MWKTHGLTSWIELDFIITSWPKRLNKTISVRVRSNDGHGDFKDWYLDYLFNSLFD